MLKNGRLSLRFDRAEACLSVKECVDKHCSAYEKKIFMDMSDMLEKCTLMSTDNYLTSPTQQSSSEMDDTWCDFQQA